MCRNNSTSTAMERVHERLQNLRSEYKAQVGIVIEPYPLDYQAVYRLSIVATLSVEEKWLCDGEFGSTMLWDTLGSLSLTDALNASISHLEMMLKTSRHN